MAALLKDALKPNLVQTLESTPPSSTAAPLPTSPTDATRSWPPSSALKLGDYVVTEAGFGADLGAEKFLDIKCRMAGLDPDAVVVVATVRALKYNGGVPKAELTPRTSKRSRRASPTCSATSRTSQRLRPALRGCHQRLPHGHRG